MERGKILPFSWINCETLTEMLAPSLSGKESGQRDFLYGRAMGRLLAHELYHTLSNKRGHSESGVGKATFSANDVLAERFTFDRSVLAQSARGRRRPPGMESSQSGLESGIIFSDSTAAGASEAGQ